MDLEEKAFDNYTARLAMRLQIIALNVGRSSSSINAMLALFHSNFTVSVPLDAVLCKAFSIVLALLFKARYTRAGVITRISCLLSPALHSLKDHAYSGITTSTTTRQQLKILGSSRWYPCMCTLEVLYPVP